MSKNNKLFLIIGGGLLILVICCCLVTAVYYISSFIRIGGITFRPWDVRLESDEEDVCETFRRRIY